MWCVPLTYQPCQCQHIHAIHSTVTQPSLQRREVRCLSLARHAARSAINSNQDLNFYRFHSGHLGLFLKNAQGFESYIHPYITRRTFRMNNLQRKENTPLMTSKIVMKPGSSQVPSQQNSGTEGRNLHGGEKRRSISSPR